MRKTLLFLGLGALLLTTAGCAQAPPRPPAAREMLQEIQRAELRERVAVRRAEAANWNAPLADSRRRARRR